MVERFICNEEVTSPSLVGSTIFSTRTIDGSSTAIIVPKKRKNIGSNHILKENFSYIMSEISLKFLFLFATLDIFDK